MAAKEDHMLSKFRGCLVGSHIGDCFGRVYEFLPVDESKLSARLKVSGHRFCGQKLLPYSDDTAMTLAVARSLLKNKGFCAKDMFERFVEDYMDKPCRGYGPHAAMMLRNIKKSNFKDIFEPARHQFGGMGSYGNGSAMRIAPVALFAYHHDRETQLKIAKESSLLTHTHRHGYNGAMLQSLAISEALLCSPSEPIDPVAFVNHLLTEMEIIEGSPPEEERPYCTQLKKILELLETDISSISADYIATTLGNEITAQRSVSSAIYCFLRGLKPLENFECDNPFVRTLFFAISLCGDTDTIGAMACSISGAYHGLEAIPKQLQRRCEALKKSYKLADQLYAPH